MHFYTSKLNKTILNFQSFYSGYFYQIVIADDLVLMSTKSEGLQNCLDNFANYCSKWG